MPKTKAKPVHHPKRAVPPVELPKSMTLTDDEKSSVAEWICLRRSKRSWIGALIQALLDWNYNITWETEPDEVREIISEFERVTVRIERIRKGQTSDIRAPRSKHAAIVQYFAAWVAHIVEPPNGGMWVVPESEEDQFYQILRQWRLEYPEPAKRRQMPSGHLGREESGD